MFLHQSVEEIKLISFFIMADSQASRDGDFSPGRRYYQLALLNIYTHTYTKIK